MGYGDELDRPCPQGLLRLVREFDMYTEHYNRMVCSTMEVCTT